MTPMRRMRGSIVTASGNSWRMIVYFVFLTA